MLIKLRKNSKRKATPWPTPGHHHGLHHCMFSADRGTQAAPQKQAVCLPSLLRDEGAEPGHARALCLVLVSQYRRDVDLRNCKTGHQDTEGTGTLLLCGEAGRAGAAEHGERWLWETSSVSINT